MATNTNNDHRIGSVKDRIQVCNPDTKECTKYDTNTGKELGTKHGEWKGVAICNDDRSDDRTQNFCQDKINK